MTEPSSSPPVSSSGKDRKFIWFVAISLLACAVLILNFVVIKEFRARSIKNQDVQLYLRNDSDPGVVLYALGEIQNRISRHERVVEWYGDIVRLSTHRDEQVRHTVADIMGEDPSRPEFHKALLELLHDRSTLVRNAAATSLAQFDDPAGHEQVVSMLQAVTVTAPAAGRIETVVSSGAKVEHGDVVAKLRNADTTISVLSPVKGWVHSVAVREGDELSDGIKIAVVEPGQEQLVKALRALQRIGNQQDLKVIVAYSSDLMTPAVREQAELTKTAIQARAGR